MEDLDSLQEQYTEARQMLTALQNQMDGASMAEMRMLRRSEHALQGKVDTLFQKIRLATSNEAYKGRADYLRKKENVE